MYCSHCKILGNSFLSCPFLSDISRGWSRIRDESWSLAGGKSQDYTLGENGGTHGNRDESQKFRGGLHHGVAGMSPTRNHEVAGSVPGLSSVS